MSAIRNESEEAKESVSADYSFRSIRRMRPWVVLLLGFSFVVLLRGQDSPDRITFTNGDVTTGIVQEMNADHVAFNGKLTGSLVYKWQDIKSIDLQSSAGRTIFFNAALSSDLASRVIRHDTDQGQVAAIHSTPSTSEGSVVSHWSGTLSSQEMVTQATQDNYQLGGSLHLAHESTAQEAWHRQILQFDSKATFSEANKANASPVRTALFEGTLSYNLYTVPSALLKNFPNVYNSQAITAIADGYHNLSLGIETQQSYGIGYAWSLIPKGKANKNGDQLEQRFGLQGDIRYSRLEQYSPGTTSDLVGAGLKESYAVSAPLPFGTKKLGFGESILTIPYFNDLRSLQIRGISSLTIALTKNQRLQLGPQVFDDFFRNAPKGTKENYFQPSLTLTYCFNPVAACK